jgi:hypothetical protein
MSKSNDLESTLPVDKGTTTGSVDTPLTKQQLTQKGVVPLTEANLSTIPAKEQVGTAVLTKSDVTVVGTPPLIAKDTPLVGGKSPPPPNPISQGILNLLFVCFLYWVSTKILAFYGISNDIYLVYFMFYVFLYVTSLLLPTDYERFD